METVKLYVKPTNGHIFLDIPTDYTDCELELVIVMSKLKNSEESKSIRYDFSKFSNKLEWDGNAVEEQRKLRDEWK
ncbi:MAG: hypothetical protein PHR06_05430 [Candidatus Cloacimonetes bacterium]|nr:hypothetical protein [Candidatus Cloacimonadota bacterium]